MSQYIYDNDELIDTKNNIIIKYEDVIDVIHELENKNDKLSKKIKDMQINNANNNMFHQAFLVFTECFLLNYSKRKKYKNKFIEQMETIVKDGTECEIIEVIDTEEEHKVILRAVV